MGSCFTVEEKPVDFVDSSSERIVEYPNGDAYIGSKRWLRKHSAQTAKEKAEASTFSRMATSTWANGYQTRNMVRVLSSTQTGNRTMANGRCLMNRQLDLKKGYGEYYYLSGAKYMGQWKDNLKHGDGSVVYEDSSTFVGVWSLGQKHGKAFITMADGRKLTEEYENGKLISRQQILPEIVHRRSDESSSNDLNHDSGERISTSSIGDFKEGFQRFIISLGHPVVPHHWTVDQTIEFLSYIGLESYAEEFREAGVDGLRLLTLSERDLKDIGVISKGHLALIRDCLLKLQRLSLMYKHRVKNMKDAVIPPFSPGKSSNRSYGGYQMTHFSLIDTIEEVQEDGTSITNRSVANSLRLSLRSYSKSRIKRIPWVTRNMPAEGGFFLGRNFDRMSQSKVRAYSAIESEIFKESDPVKAYDDYGKGNKNNTCNTTGFVIEDIDRFQPENENFYNERREKISQVAQPSCTSGVVSNNSGQLF